MSATALLAWGVTVHLVCDWLLQNDWMARNKANLHHPAGYVHAGIHAAGQLVVFPWWAALLIGISHLLIDTRRPVVWWSRLIRQTQPQEQANGVMDIGMDVRVWSDQVWHVAVVAALAVVA